MAIRYFCDRCNAVVENDNGLVSLTSYNDGHNPPKISVQVCHCCIDAINNFIKSGVAQAAPKHNRRKEDKNKK
jgi:hypothetical protein